MILNEKPSWFYKLVEIENLGEIQEELCTALYKLYPNFNNAKSNYVFRGPLITRIPNDLNLLQNSIIIWKADHIIR